MTPDNQKAWERASELLDRIDIQCRAVGHPVGGIGELKAIYGQALTAQPVTDDVLKRAIQIASLNLNDPLSNDLPDSVLETLIRAATAPKNCDDALSLASPETWPIAHNAMGVNEWNKDAAGFVRFVQDNPGFWGFDTDLKYLRIHMDTRNGQFLLINGDQRLSPDRVLEAISKMHKRGY